jgi:branched-chain amino acid transport system ATP-binding protein
VSALSISGLSKRYGGVLALSGVSFAVEAGERRVLIGPNGAGKTTLFHAISGAVLPSAGSIAFFDKDITRMPPNRRAALGMARTFQVTNLFSRLTVLENVLLAVAASGGKRLGLLRPMTAHRELFVRAERLLEEWGLAQHAHVEVRQLSYGDQRQIELVLALAGSPKALLLDEPTAGLSPAETGRVAAMIRKLPRDMTILMIEHDMDVAFDLADRILVLHQGQVIAEGDQKAIRAHPQVSEIYLGEA